MIKYSHKVGFYVSSYDLAKATGKKHQNLMTTVRRKHKYYIHYEHQDHQYYKNQKIYFLTANIIKKINKTGEFNDLLREMEKKEKEFKEQVSKAFNSFWSKFY